MPTPRIFKPIYLSEETGELGRLPDGAVVNIGGVEGPLFTVGGRGLLFDDGSSTSPTPGTGFTLDVAYANSTAPATINLTAGKNFVLDAVNSKKFIFDASTGTVTIEGNLNVLGASTVIEGTVSNLDQVNIRPPSSSTVGLTLQPMLGVVPAVNLLEVAVVAGGPLVLKVAPSGVTTIADVVVSGTFNGVPAATLAAHVDGSTVPVKHSAVQVSVNDVPFTNISGTTVQAALESIDSRLTTLGVGNVAGYEYVQSTPATVWAINHGSNTTRVQVTVWDETNTSILPDAMTITNPNTVFITFASPQAGRAILMLF